MPVILTAEAASLPTNTKELFDDRDWWDAIEAERMICQFTPELIPQDMSASHGNLMMTEMNMLQSLKSCLAKKRQKEQQNRASGRLSSSLTPWSMLR